MRRIRILTICILALVLTSLNLNAQNEGLGGRVQMNGKAYYTYIVRAKETLYSICKQYNVTIEEMLEANPELVNGLKSNSEILILDRTAKYISTLPVYEKGGKKIKESDSTNIKTSNSQFDRRSLFGNTNIVHDETENDLVYKPVIGLILPVDVASGVANNNYLDFYSGALLAADNLRRSGISIDINLYDQGDYKSLYSLSKRVEQDKNNILIGPVRINEFGYFIDYADKNKILIVSPMDPAVEKYIDSSKFVIHIPTPKANQTENMVSSLAKKYENTYDSKVVVICERNGKEGALLHEIETLLHTKNVKFSVVSYGILEGKSVVNTLNSQMIQSPGKNMVIIASTKEAFVTDAVRNLDICRKAGCNISLYGFPKWKNFDNIEPALLHHLNLHISLPYYVDYSNEEVKTFLLKYRALFNAEPTAYSYQGYDIIKYFADNISKMSLKKFLNNMPASQMLQCNFDFHRRLPKSGFENIATKDIVYNDDLTISVTPLAAIIE